MSKNNSDAPQNSTSYLEPFYQTLKLLALTSGIVTLLIILLYIIFISKGYYHADCSDTITWAEAMVDGNTLMNPDFQYACLLPFGGQLLMAPFVAIFGVGMKAQLIGMSLFAIIFAFALTYLCRAMKFSYGWCSAATTALFLILSASEKLREIFWCHIIYYSLGVLFLMIGMALVIQIINSTEFHKRHYIILFVWTMLCSTNGSQALTIYVLPVLAAVIGERFFDTTTPLLDKKNLKSGIITLTLIISALCGVLLAKIINGDIVAGYQSGYSGFDKKELWLENFLNIIPQMFTLFGIVSPETEIFTLTGIITLIKIIFVLILMVVPVIMLVMYKKFESKAYRLMILMHTVLSLLLIMAWVFGELNSACWRLSPMLATSVILCVMFVKWLFNTKTYVRMSAIILIPLCIVLMSITSEIYTCYTNKQSAANKRLDNISNYLEANNLEYGYATFWNANSITLMTDSKVKVRCIKEDSGTLRPRMYQTNINWYKDNSYDRYFLLLTESEYYAYTSSDTYKTPLQLLICEGHYIMIYDYNIMELK